MVCRYFGFTADWENWGENDRMSEGRGAGKRFFFPLPLPLPQFFFLSPTLGKLFTSPQLSTVFLFQDGGLNIRWKYISTRPAKIRLHCRLISNKHAIFENKRRERYSINYNDYTLMPTGSVVDSQCFLLSQVISMFEVIPDKKLG